MKLSKKVIGILLLSVSLLILFYFIFAKLFLLKSYTKIEVNRALLNTNTVAKYIQKDLTAINSLNLDYAKWDDTYNYVKNRNNDYIQSNFSNVSGIKRSKADFIIITDRMGNVIYSKNISSEGSLSKSLVQNVSSYVYKYLNNDKDKNATGIFSKNKVSLLISAETITNNDSTSDAIGLFIFGKYFDKNEINDITRDTGFKVQMLPYDKVLIADSDSSTDNNFVKVSSRTSLTGYSMLNNIDGTPSLLLKVTLPRDVYKQAVKDTNFYFGILILASLILSAIIFTLIDLLVVKRINKLKSTIDKIRSSRDFSLISNVEGNDEISELSLDFNSMLYRLKQSNDKISELAYYDSLTGLPNRQNMVEHFDKILSNKPEKFAVFLIGLDNFRSINNNFGYNGGDYVLVKVAERLKNIVKPNCKIGRVGNDEFIMILENLKSTKNAEEVAASIIKKLNTVFVYKENHLFIGASIGISISPDHGNDVDTLIKNANLAMHQVKNKGGLGYSIYSSTMKNIAVDKLKMRIKLKKALESNEFMAYYQPVMSLSSMKIISAEALIRWKQGNNIIPPINFIPMAKGIGEIVAIDNWMLQNACMQCKKWHDNGAKDFCISVNTSYKQLKQVNFIDLVINTLHKYSLDPKCLTLEITEDEAMEDPDLIINILTKLKSYGIIISLDDFGTGYSSLSYINKLPVDIIKIDRSLIMNLEEDSKNIFIIKLIIMMAHSLNIDVLAEGIETDAQFNILNNLKCDYIQGYLIGKPMDNLDFEKKINIKETQDSNELLTFSVYYICSVFHFYLFHYKKYMSH
jgi:diguanylate cyclase (GGDEF)-like protein